MKLNKDNIKNIVRLFSLIDPLYIVVCKKGLYTHQKASIMIYKSSKNGIGIVDTKPFLNALQKFESCRIKIKGKYMKIFNSHKKVYIPFTPNKLNFELIGIFKWYKLKIKNNIDIPINSELLIDKDGIHIINHERITLLHKKFNVIASSMYRFNIKHIFNIFSDNKNNIKIHLNQTSQNYFEYIKIMNDKFIYITAPTRKFLSKISCIKDK